MLVVPTNVIPDLVGSASASIGALLSLIAVVIALPMTFYFFRKIKQMFPH